MPTSSPSVRQTRPHSEDPSIVQMTMDSSALLPVLGFITNTVSIALPTPGFAFVSPWDSLGVSLHESSAIMSWQQQPPLLSSLSSPATPYEDSTPRQTTPLSPSSSFIKKRPLLLPKDEGGNPPGGRNGAWLPPPPPPPAHSSLVLPTIQNRQDLGPTNHQTTMRWDQMADLPPSAPAPAPRESGSPPPTLLDTPNPTKIRTSGRRSSWSRNDRIPRAARRATAQVLAIQGHGPGPLDARDADDDDDNNNNNKEDEDNKIIRIPFQDDLSCSDNYQDVPPNKSLMDQTILQTRVECNQLLVQKVFKPYCRMIRAAMDAHLEGMDQNDASSSSLLSSEDFFEVEWIKAVRVKMLKDPLLNEKEIAAFFEGCQLFQMKVDSLQRQLDHHTSKTVHQHQSYATHHHKDDETLSTRPTSYGKSRTWAGEGCSRNNSDLAKEVSFATTQHPRARTHDDDNDPDTQQPIMPSLSSSMSLRQSKATTTTTTTTTSGLETGTSPSLRTMSIQRIRNETSGRKGSEDIQKLLVELEEAERRQKKLEKQLAQAGVVIAEDIPYSVAIEKVNNIAQRMQEIGFANSKDAIVQEEYFLLEREMNKYTAALELTDDWIEKQEELEREWENEVASANEAAIKDLRRHMPIDVHNQSEASLATDVTPNGKVLPKEMAKRFKRTNVLQLLRIDPEDIVAMHAATLEGLRVTGLTLTERRALHHHLKDIGLQWKAMQGDKMTERKWTWFFMMKSNFKEKADAWQRHVEQYGPPDNHPYFSHNNPDAGGCPLIGKQCPLRANQVIQYDGDYGYPERPKYFRTEVKKSVLKQLSTAKKETNDQFKEKKSEERGAKLKSHYKGNLLLVALANGSCGCMDDMMDTIETTQESWIKRRLAQQYSSDEAIENEIMRLKDVLKDLKLSVLQFAERSGMQVTGKREANADQHDTRSTIELALCEEVIETAIDFLDGIDGRLAETGLHDAVFKVTLQQMRTLLEELHDRNVSTIKALGQGLPPRSRELKTQHDIKKNIQRTIHLANVASPALARGAHAASPIRGVDQLGPLNRGGGGVDLFGMLRGRGIGPGRDGSPGGLMAAIANQGKQES